MAQLYYAPKKPDDQLKDLCEVEKGRVHIETNWDFCAYCIENLVPEDLQKIAQSFALFKEQVELWFAQN